MATEGQGLTRIPGGLIRCSVAVPITVTATANTDFTFNIPAVARNVVFRAKTTTAFGAATDAQLQIGKTAGGSEYVAGTTIKSAGDTVLTNATTNIADLETMPGALGSLVTVTARLVQTGTASATGAATLFADYSIPV